MTPSTSAQPTQMEIAMNAKTTSAPSAPAKRAPEPAQETKTPNPVPPGEAFKNLPSVAQRLYTHVLLFHAPMRARKVYNKARVVEQKNEMQLSNATLNYMLRLLRKTGFARNPERGQWQAVKERLIVPQAPRYRRTPQEAAAAKNAPQTPMTLGEVARALEAQTQKLMEEAMSARNLAKLLEAKLREAQRNILA